ncbi:hypothetical protein SynBIOSE41_01110 [Synechococcus sp. BIOS-E4-1]|uniref:hypothetical protein n=1 Tax=unclassified Synechococcus TaxID=2626047 RepID=UPI001648A725|nr:hypothetical protein [Synechococcus sp. BIOS-E4-1]QNI53632.1 hypothetical protein SynBIOSE41_01110 [Synechococcus sp. BIOS-E4-1]
MTTSAPRLDRFLSVYKMSMKSKLSIIASVATVITFSGLAVYSSPDRFEPATELANKQRGMEFQSAGHCNDLKNPVVCPWIMK